MKKFFVLAPLMVMSLSGCAKIDQMNSVVQQSTESIHANREAVEINTATIYQNSYFVEESTKALEQNRLLLEKAGES